MTCNDSAYHVFCSQIYPYAPACDEIDKNNIPPAVSFLNDSLESGLVLQMFELGRLFLEQKMIKFYIQGSCMYPCIRPKDTLHLEPRSAGQIRVGDIAVYRRYNQLFAHRTIDKGTKDGQDYIVTRPDTARSGNDGPSFDKDILGIVARIERKGAILSTVAREYSPVIRLFHDTHIYIRRLGGYFWSRLADLHNYLQQYIFFRVVANLFFINSKIDFFLQASHSSKPTGRFFSKLSLEDLRDSLQGGSPLSKWQIILTVNSKAAGYLSFFLKPARCPYCGWWLYSAHLKARYKGTNIERMFFNKAHDVLKKLGITDVCLSLFKYAGVEKIFFKNMGFNEAAVSKDIFSTDKNKAAVGRIIMKKTIPCS